MAEFDMEVFSLAEFFSPFEEYSGATLHLDFPIQGSKPSDVPEDPDRLKVEKVDLDILRNVAEHHTDQYDITDVLQLDDREMLVVRRGQKFNMKIDFTKDYDPKKHDLRLVFKFGKNPIPTNGTHKEFKLSEEDLPNEWGAFITEKKDKSIYVTLMTPPDCHVGKWKLNIDVVIKVDDKEIVNRHACKDPIYILFNPWCKDDQVYMDDSDLLEEYVLNDFGKVYTGTAKRPWGKPWNFGQFDGDILDCILMLLDDSNFQDRARNDPVLVSRKLSALINSSDDRGVLTGNWSGNYEGGTSPTEWQGSVKILEEYYKTKTPVKYGQCWVFSGVLTTACRALGIPARSVTNFSSAHDTDANVFIDTYLNISGEENEYFTNDSVWNFHVWNDVWMKRPDLENKEYNGWQAIDATPQETSDGIYCMGPMPLNAIKAGDVNQPYDGKFVFSEVNGDRCYWIKHNSMDLVLLHVDPYSIGKSISTKLPESNRRHRDVPWYDFMREDVTNQYKYPDGSTEGRKAVERACKDSERRDRVFGDKPTEDIKYEFTYSNDVQIGDPIEVTLKMTNTSNETRVLDGNMIIYSKNNKGKRHATIAEHSLQQQTFAPKEEKIIKIKRTVQEYYDNLFEFSNISVAGIGLVKGTFQSVYKTGSFRLLKPEVTITCPDKVKAGEKFQVNVSFTNPLHIPLTGCKLKVEALDSESKFDIPQEDVKAFGKFEGKFELASGKKKHGKRIIIAAFICKELNGLDMDRPITVEPALVEATTEEPME